MHVLKLHCGFEPISEQHKVCTIDKFVFWMVSTHLCGSQWEQVKDVFMAQCSRGYRTYKKHLIPPDRSRPRHSHKSCLREAVHCPLSASRPMSSLEGSLLLSAGSEALAFLRRCWHSAGEGTWLFRKSCLVWVAALSLKFLSCLVFLEMALKCSHEVRTEAHSKNVVFSTPAATESFYCASLTGPPHPLELRWWIKVLGVF